MGRLWGLSGLALLGCVGSIEETESDSAPGRQDDDNKPNPACSSDCPPDDKVPVLVPDGKCAEGVSQVSPFRRLTNDEYQRSVALLLKDETPLVAKLPAADHESPVVSAAWSEGTMELAEEAAARFIKRLDTLLPCKPAGGASGEESCATEFIAAFGKQAFRRPLSAEENTRLLAMYKQGKTSVDFAHGVEMVVRTVLQSPHFLYRVELGDADPAGTGVVKLTPYQVATRMSFALWGSAPDAALLAAADTGGLDNPEDIATQARRLLADSRGLLNLRRFHEHWMGLGAPGTPLTSGLAVKDTSVYKEFNMTLADSMRRDTTSFLDFVLKEESGRLEALLTSPTAFVTPDLAPIYGVPAPPSGPVSATKMDPTKRVGILTNPGFLAVHTKADDRDVIHRGVAIRNGFLCAPTPAPPDNVPDTPDVVLENVACKGCHDMINPIGSGFAHYDGLGRWRDTEGGQPIDATGEIVGTDDLDGTFDGVPQLARKLLGSRQVQECVVSHFMEFALGPADACAKTRLADAYVNADMDIHELAVAMAASGGFGYRLSVSGAVQP